MPGVATYYATTCRECPAGCGVWARTRYIAVAVYILLTVLLFRRPASAYFSRTRDGLSPTTH